MMTIFLVAQIVSSTPIYCIANELAGRQDDRLTCLRWQRDLPACPTGTIAAAGHRDDPQYPKDGVPTHDCVIPESDWERDLLLRVGASFRDILTSEIATLESFQTPSLPSPTPAPTTDRSKIFDALALGFAVGAGPRSGVGVGALRGANLAREQHDWERAIASPSLTPVERLMLQQQWRQWRETQESQQWHRPINCWGTLSGDVFQWFCS